MSAAILAPPAGPSPLGEADLDAEAHYELIDGRREVSPPMGIYAVKVATRLTIAMGSFALQSRLGEVVSEGIFRIPTEGDRGRSRRPDVAFVSEERWPTGTPETDDAAVWDVVPDLAVEVVSPTDLFDAVVGKVAEYFRAGVRLVWVILPLHRQAYVYEGPAGVRIVGDDGSLDGGVVLPGFRIALAEILGPPAARV